MIVNEAPMKELKKSKSSNPNLLRFRLTGTNGIILHNGQLSDPLNKFTKELKKVTSKKMKTDADHERVAELEFLGGLYVNEDGRVILPPEGIKACVVSGAKKTKEGQIAKAGVWVSSPALLEYDGPQTPAKLWEDERFRIRTKVVVERKTVMRTRPIFRKWAATVEVSFNPSICNAEQVLKWLTTCGEYGSFDWRPDYGHFTVEAL
jgi:hypothetical protein